MKQTILETRQRAKDLLQQAIAIWRQSDQSDFLEGLEDDPVFSLLMMAIAYQGSEIDNEIARLKEEVLDEFARNLAPYEMGHATPATLVVQTATQKAVPEVELNASSVFRLASSHPFIPLLHSRVLGIKQFSVVRVDGRRWKVTLDFSQPVRDLSGFTFAVEGLDFRDLTVTVGKHLVPLIRPWDYSELPFNECFVPHNIIYTRQQIYNMSMLPLELFARHNVRLYCIDKHRPALLLPQETERLELMFEFSGITDNFLFDKTRLLLNTLILVNAQLQEVTLSAQQPLARIAGFDDAGEKRELTSRQFMQLLQPSENQIYGNAELMVRQVLADRFNQGSLVKLLNCVLNKYHSDFYAFRNLRGMTTDQMVYNLQEAMTALVNVSTEDVMRSVPGVYLMLRDKSQMHNKDFSVSVRYLTTAGAAINQFLNDTIKLEAPSGLDNSETIVIKQPVQGTDDIKSRTEIDSLLRYYMLTGDRIVTPADIKVFCFKELTTRYGLSESMINRIRVSRRQTNSRRDCGYEIVVEITLEDNSFVKRIFSNSLPTAAVLMEKMLEIRSAGIYPISVSINL